MTGSELSATESSIDTHDNQVIREKKIIDDSHEIAQMDEVFEAFISQDIDLSALGFDDDFVTQDDKIKAKKAKKQSTRVINELKSALICRQQEFEVRESRAVARQNKIDNDDYQEHLDNNDSEANKNTEGYLSVPKSLIKTNILGE